MIAAPTVQLKEVAKIDRTGVSPSEIDDGTLYVGLEHIESGGRLLDIQPVGNGDLASTKFRFTPKHILYGKLRPYLAKIASPDFSGICSTDILPILPGPKLDRAYLLHYLRQPSMVEFATSRSSGANLPRLSPKALADFEIPLPPLQEQRRIAAILDQADALSCTRKRAIEHLNILGQSIFHEMFATEVASDDWLPLGEIVNEFRYGTSNKATSEGYPTLRIPNIIGGDININDLKTVVVTEKEFGRLKLSEGDLLFVRTNGNPAYVGRCSVVPDIIDGKDSGSFIYASYLIRARLHYPETGVFLSAFLKSVVGRKQLLENAKTSAGQYNINIEGLSAIKVPNASTTKQKLFRDKILNIREPRISYSLHSQELEDLFHSLQQRAFRGDL